MWWHWTRDGVGSSPNGVKNESPLGTEPSREDSVQEQPTLMSAPIRSGWLRASTQQQDRRQGLEPPREVPGEGRGVALCTFIGQLLSCSRMGRGLSRVPGWRVVPVCV